MNANTTLSGRSYKQTILFDLDDTLIYCNKFFELVIDQFVDQMDTWFHSFKLDHQELKQRQNDIDMARVLKLGFAPGHFPMSLVDTYSYYSDMTGRARYQDEMDRLVELGKSVYSHNIEPLPNMEETLYSLQSEGHSLHLYTGGDRTVQMRKVHEAGLERFFSDRIYVTNHKNTSFLASIVKDKALSPASTWMIGNSLRTDVIPALENGLHSIYIPAELEWAYNMVEVDVKPQGAFLQLASLSLVPGAISGYAAG
jgi:putative hydrolase of the HAD superfamily